MRRLCLGNFSHMLFGLLVSLSAAAQGVTQADVAEIQSQIRRGENGFSACGVRAVVGVIVQKEIVAYDFSLIIDAKSHYALAKAGKTINSTKALLEGKHTAAVTPAPTNFWAVPEKSGKLIPPKKIIPAENRGFILAAADLVQTYESILAMAHGERMHFAVRYKDEPVDNVIAFAANMSDAERASLMTCLDSVIAQLSESVK